MVLDIFLSLQQLEPDIQTGLLWRYLNVNAAAYIEKFPRACQAIQENHYVEDLLDCFGNEEEAITIAKENTNLMELFPQNG